MVEKPKHPRDIPVVTVGSPYAIIASKSADVRRLSGAFGGATPREQREIYGVGPHPVVIENQGSDSGTINAILLIERAVAVREGRSNGVPDVQGIQSWLEIPAFAQAVDAYMQRSAANESVTEAVQVVAGILSE